VETESGKWEKKINFQKRPEEEDKYWIAVRQSLFALPLGTVTQAEYQKNIDLKKAIQKQIAFNSRENFKWNSEDWRIAKKDLRKRINETIFRFNNDEQTILKHFADNPPKDEEGNNIEKIDLLRFVKFASKRRTIDDKFTADVIKKMPDSGLEKNWLTKLLKEHLADAEYNNSPALAFKGEGLEQLYKKAKNLGKPDINKVTVMDGEAKNKIALRNYLLEGVAGVNQYFLVEIKKIIDKKTGEEKLIRKYTTPDFLDCINRLARGLQIHDEDPNSQYIVLSPGELVFVPEEGENVQQIDWTNKKRIAARTYIMKSSNNGQCFFVPNMISKPLVETSELGANNKSERAWDKKM
ncbi:MAG: hypothetical protein HYZ42_17290, partial [Bacteroidetes bacterium]|nr:hypothetical protein [Bacteroidota bacterium]